MTLGEAINDFFTKTLGVKSDDPALVKVLVGLGDLAKTDMGATPIETFTSLFVTIDEAKKNPAVKKYVSEEIKPAMWVELSKNFEDALFFMGKDAGLKDDALTDYEKAVRNKDLKISERLDLATKTVVELSKKPGDDTAAQKKIDELQDKLNSLKREKTAELEAVQKTHKAELEGINTRIVSEKLYAHATEKIKFRDDFPDKRKMISGKIAEEFTNKFHIATTDDGKFKLMQKDAPDKVAFDETTGKDLDFDSHLESIFGTEWRAKDAGTGSNGGGKNKFTTKENEGENGRLVPTNVQAHMSEAERAIKASQGD